MKLAVLGWYDHQNIGDDSYKLTFPKCLPGNEFRFTDLLTENDIKWCDAVILGGGNVFKEDFLRQLRGLSKPVYGLSVGVESDFNAYVPFKHVWARENKSLELLKKNGVPCSLCPDLAFALQGNANSGKQWLVNRFKDEKLDLYSRVVVMVVNNYLIHGHPQSLSRDAFHFMDFSYKLAKVCDDLPASIVFVPFGSSGNCDDRVASSWVSNKCKWWKKNLVIYDRLSVQNTLDLIAASDTVVSTRLHSSIFAYSCGVPFVDITHHSKNMSFLELINRKEQSVSFWDFNVPEVHSKICKNLTLSKDTEADKYRKLIQETLHAVRFSE